LPVDASFSQHEAIAINGIRILAVGNRAEVRAAADSVFKVVGLDGKPLLPGFIEPHIHFALMAGLGYWPDIGPFKYESTREALDALKAITMNTPGDEWIVARQCEMMFSERKKYNFSIVVRLLSKQGSGGRCTVTRRYLHWASCT
jgi:predicted amidohydrolase YtcJ